MVSPAPPRLPLRAPPAPAPARVRPLRWPHVRSVCLQPQARGPRRGVRGRRHRVPDGRSRRLQRRAHQGGLRRPGAAAAKDERRADAPAERQLRVLRWGLVPSWAKDPTIGNRMINARMETVAEKPAFRRAFAEAALPAAGRRLLRVVPDRAARQGRQAAQAAVLHPAQGRRRAGDGRALRDLARPDPADDDPDRFRWTCTVLTTDGRGRPRPHPRPDAADGRAGPVVELARPDRRGDDLLDLLVPAAPGRLEAYPVSTEVSNVRNNGPELVEPLPLEDVPLADDCDRATEQSVATPHGDGRLVTLPARARPVATLVLGHGAGGGVDARDLVALAAALPRRASACMLFEQPWRVAGRKVASPPATLDAGCAPPPTRCGPAPRWSSAAAPPARGRRAAAPNASARPGCLALAFPLHPPGRPEKSRLDELPAPGCRPWSCRGSATRSGGPRSSPTDARPGRRPGADHGFAVPAERRHPGGRAGRSWSSRRWSGSSARSSGIAERIR